MIYIGTDIYLTWDKQTKKEKEDQVTGFDIGAGNKGYLRASIGMVLENSVLRGIFPEEYWNSKTVSFDFKANWKNANIQIASYLMTRVMSYCGGLPQVAKFAMKTDEKAEQAEEFGKTIKEALGKLVGGEAELSNEQNSLEFDVMWANSVLQFFRLGIEKQEAGLNPKIHISW